MHSKDRWVRWLARGLCAAVVAAVGVHGVRTVLERGPTDFDDAYMFLRYARNLLDGHGVVWNPGEGAVHGATSLMYLMLVTGLRALMPALADGRLLQVASGAAAAAALAVLVLACARATTIARDPQRVPDPPRSGYGGRSPPPPTRRHPRLSCWLWAALLVPTVGLGEAFLFHAGTGMDTTLSLLANALCCLASLRLGERPSRSTAILAALAGYLAFLVRPDNAFYAVLVPVLAVALLCPPPRRELLVTVVAVLVAAFAVDLVVKRVTLGTALPLSFYAKRPGNYAGFAGEYTWNAFLFLRVFLTAAAPFLLVLLALGRRSSLRPALVWLIPTALTLAALFSLNHIMGHLGRFFFPSLPYLVIAAAVVLDCWLSGQGFVASWALGARLALAVGVLAGGHLVLGAAAERYEAPARTQTLASLGGYRVTATPTLPEIDSWRSAEEIGRMAGTVPAGTRFAMSEHGLPGARAPRAIIIDLLGLHDRAFAPFSAAELWRRRPDVIWMPHPDHTQMVRDILDSNEFWQRYLFYPDAFTYGLALRKDSHPAVLAAFRQRWAAVYPTQDREAYRARRF